MIKYTLNCNNGHQFDSWFSDSDSFEKLREKGHLECAICGSKKVEKSLMAPVVTPKKKEALLAKQSTLEKEIKALKQKIKATATDVGHCWRTERGRERCIQ